MLQHLHDLLKEPAHVLLHNTHQPKDLLQYVYLQLKVPRVDRLTPFGNELHELWWTLHQLTSTQVDHTLSQLGFRPRLFCFPRNLFKDVMERAIHLQLAEAGKQDGESMLLKAIQL